MLCSRIARNKYFVALKKAEVVVEIEPVGPLEAEALEGEEKVDAKPVKDKKKRGRPAIAPDRCVGCERLGAKLSQGRPHTYKDQCKLRR